MKALPSARSQTMRIAITAAGKDLDAEIDPRFGRAQYVIVVDPDGNIIEVIDNEANRDAMSGAGIQAAKMLADKKVNVLLTGRCGPNATEALKAAGIDFREVRAGTVREALEDFNRGEIPKTSDRGSDLDAAVLGFGPGRGGGRGQGAGGGRGRGIGRGMGRGRGGGRNRWFE